MNSSRRFTLELAIVICVAFALSASLSVLNDRSYKRNILKSRLEVYCDLVSGAPADSLPTGFLPQGVRVTLMNLDGAVIWDSALSSDSLGNHSGRPEVKDCIKKGEGISIRRSDSSPVTYFYYAKRYPGIIVRSAQVFELEERRYMRADSLLIVSILLIFLLSLIAVMYLYRRYRQREKVIQEQMTRRLKHEMTGNIAHELRTPVSSIRLYLETILGNPSLESGKKELFLQRSYQQTLRLTEMISDISMITKLEEAPEQFKVEPVNLKFCLDEVCEEMSSALEDKGLRVKNNLPPLCIHGSYTLIYAIFRNLIENSIKYATDADSIEVDYSKGAAGEHELDYRDNGRGVNDSELEKIFERFYRIDSDRSKTGSGLGLSIVRNAVLFHKGSIKAYRVSPTGLGFHFTLKDLKR